MSKKKMGVAEVDKTINTLSFIIATAFGILCTVVVAFVLRSMSS